MNKLALATLSAALFLPGTVVHAAQRIAVLAFELNDLTSLPNTPQEQVRTASIRPLLEAAIRQADDGYETVPVSPQAQAMANGSFGYLFRFHDLAAKLGGQAQADWVVVGQHSKPSFLFSYLMAHVINVKTGMLAASFDVELKGNHEAVTRHGAVALAKKIKGAIGSGGAGAVHHSH
ncbi:DUF2380 domain-containing protein [Methylovulum miyakonense]|uniref:DUF2380 domain-containing protein n=1 Tax=Methylovulum miyakonense TaxID=645578 RepID=UPI00037DDB5C|nr:DUF2380 domain-containing protein [Methylovulum miyakonense]